MKLAGFLLLFLLTDRSTYSHSEKPELLDDQQKSNHSFGGDGSTSNCSEKVELDYQQKSDQSFEGGGNTSDNSYVYDDDTDHNKDAVDKVNCSYQILFNHLNLTKNMELYTMVRPDFNEITYIHLQMSLYSIFDVREIDQTFISYVWIYMGWGNKYIGWHPSNFCGLEKVVVPKELLWRPDITIEEMTEKDKSPPTPFLTLRWDGKVEFRNDQVLVSSCRMQIFKFPFDIQSCNLSFKSVVYSDKELKFDVDLNVTKITRWSRELMRTQYEWLFINISAEEKTVNNFSYNQSMIVYTIKMRRRSVLYIINFILPVLFFFCLDLASFLMSDTGGEKVGFKVTVLLAVTVMQLILNDILPSSSDRIPLIAVYCIGMFGLMLLSLLETILMMYLVEKDSASQDNDADEDQSLSEDCGDKQGKDNCDGEVKKWNHCACVCDVSADEPPSELLSVAKEGSSSQLMECSVLKKVSDELTAVQKTLTLLLNSRKEEGKLGYWTRVTKTINKVFFIFYITSASVFLIIIFSIWANEDYK
ncbi:5-hydroxytryptamine receptor 3C-like isoform X2 [Epinephelus lanceolatus]|uniref:5-hydroxytryptamine receptor 3A-like isoform X2 n=1 Tax=Epinephelus lanceolatus TaxID=310571 RepID=UPI001444A817|nr:5-hydroxytryptamine receptor 3A-like isoform X2 [Epinephelus lanceolatus]